MDFQELSIANAVELAQKKLAILRSLDAYLEWGGFPEVVRASTPLQKRELLVRYFEDILFKDIVKRFGIKEIGKLENLANILLANIAILQSFNKLKERLKVSLDTVERFAKYLEMARMFFFLKKFDYSICCNRAELIFPFIAIKPAFCHSYRFGLIACPGKALVKFERSGGAILNFDPAFK